MLKADGRSRAVFKEAWRRLPVKARQKYYDEAAESLNGNKSLILGNSRANARALNK